MVASTGAASAAASTVSGIARPPLRRVTRPRAPASRRGGARARRARRTEPHLSPLRPRRHRGLCCYLYRARGRAALNPPLGVPLPRGGALASGDCPGRGASPGRGARGAAPQGGPSLLHLFSGPPTDPESVCGILRSAGWGAVGLDWTNPFGRESQDLSSDSVWERVLRDTNAGRYDLLVLTPPAGTFAAPSPEAGAAAARTAAYPYGRPKGEVSQEIHEAVRLSTYYVLQSIRAARAAVSVGAGFVLLGPCPNGASGSAPFGLLPEARALALEPQVCTIPLEGGSPAPADQWGLMYSGPDCASLRGRLARDVAGRGPVPRRAEPRLARGIAWAAASRGRRTLPVLSGAIAPEP